MSEERWRIVFTKKGPVHYDFGTESRTTPCKIFWYACECLPDEDAIKRRHCKNCNRILAARKRGKRA
jgi:hypothetical protein